jgi:putative transport protein
MHRKWIMSDIALTVSVLALVAVVGLWIGNIKIRGVGFGIGGCCLAAFLSATLPTRRAGAQRRNAALYSGIRPDPLRLYHRYPGGAGLFRLSRVSGLRLNLFASALS